MKTINLAPRMESHERYEANRAINELISKSFTDSVGCYIANEITAKPYGNGIFTNETPFFINPTTTIPSGDYK